jgi:hypothetical protein
MRRHACYLVVIVAMFLLPAEASAFSAAIEGGVLRFQADPEEGQQVVSLSYEAGAYRLVTAPRTSFARQRLGPGCARDARGLSDGISCNGAGVVAVEVALGDGDDIFTIGTSGVPVSYSGGEGRDQAEYLAFASGAPRVVMDNDGVADDGPGRHDNIRSDVESLWGEGEPDTLGAGPKPTLLVPGGGDDIARGGPADDVIHAVLVSTGGDSRGPIFELFPAGRDKVSCGAGSDSVVADRRDDVAGDCEIVGRDGARWRNRPAYAFVGSDHADRIALSTILPPTTWMRTIVSSGRGNDRIDARDASFKQRPGDVIHCGAGRDIVYADGADRAFKDCERVRR